MSFKTDNGGEAIRINDAKLFFGDSSTWATRLSQLAKVNGSVYISTFSLPDLPYAQKILEKRPHDILIVAHSMFHAKALAIKDAFPDIRIALRDNIHAKFVLAEPKTVWLSSANFGRSGWIEHGIGMHSPEAFEFYRKAFNNIFTSSEEIVGSPKLEETANSSGSEKYHVILRNCPFCGKSIAECNIIHHPNGVYIECSCGAYGALSGKAEHTIRLWNTQQGLFPPKKKHSKTIAQALEPCPVCGGEILPHDISVLAISSNQVHAHVRCPHCHTKGGIKETVYDAVKVWNMRSGLFSTPNGVIELNKEKCDNA